MHCHSIDAQFWKNSPLCEGRIFLMLDIHTCSITGIKQAKVFSLLLLLLQKHNLKGQLLLANASVQWLLPLWIGKQIQPFTGRFF